MKFPALLVATSLAANAGLLGYIALRPAASSAGAGISAPARSGAQARPAAAGEHALPPPDTWERVYAEDLSAYTENLRAAGLPDRLVRALINAEINERFKAREEALKPPRPPKKYWENNDNYYNDPTTLEQRMAQLDLRREKDALRRQLLGDPPAKPDDNNPIPAPKRDLLRQISEDYDTMIGQVQRESRGITLPSDDEKLRYLRAEKEQEMRSLLTPVEYQEYELRSSQTANQLRWDLTAFSASEDEFRALYALKKPFDEQFPNQQGDPGQDYWQRRNEAEKVLNEQIKQQLGEERYQDYRRAKDYDYRNLANLTDRLGLPPATAAAVYDLRYNVPGEALRVLKDNNLEPATKLESLKTLAQKAREQVYAKLGTEAGDAYIQRQARWIGSLEKGQVIEFSPDGGQRHHSIPQPSPPAVRTK